MPLKIDFLKNHPDSLPRLSEIWHEVLGKIWIPDVSLERVVERFKEHLNENSLPLTFVALEENRPIGMCSLRIYDGIRSDLIPWLGSLVVEPAYQKRGVGTILIETTKQKAKDFGFTKIYLSTFDPRLPQYYARLGWKIWGMDKFENHPVTVMEIEL